MGGNKTKFRQEHAGMCHKEEKNIFNVTHANGG
jgi:hypothetical protein